MCEQLDLLFSRVLDELGRYSTAVSEVDLVDGRFDLQKTTSITHVNSDRILSSSNWNAYNGKSYRMENERLFHNSNSPNDFFFARWQPAMIRKHREQRYSCHAQSIKTWR